MRVWPEQSARWTLLTNARPWYTLQSQIDIILEQAQSDGPADPVYVGGKLFWGKPFEQKDEQVIKAVDRQIAETIKPEKGILRSCFLLITYYRTQAKYLPAHIGRQVQKRLEHGSELFLLTEIPPHCLVRLAYIRLETIVFVDSGSKARAAQWGPIDKQLLFMRSQTADYRLASKDNWGHPCYTNRAGFAGRPKPESSTLATTPKRMVAPTSSPRLGNRLGGPVVYD
ncbi:hypothetical protein KEM48_005306 [Puccinia striiformis f. sp. tritici PST-130]|nr:hypothetical protein KEM48_005306 [Puccinia striiformis f. sp. tritici PST-130]